MVNKLMISCKRSTELTEKKLHTGLTVSESIQWRLHTSVCSACKNYVKQSKFIEEVVQKSISNPQGDSRITDEDAQKLINKILNE